MKTILLQLMLMLFNIIASAQQFPIAVNSRITGSGIIIRNKKVIKIESKQFYYSDDIIKINKPELTLLLKNNKYIKIIKSGEYNLNDLINSSEAIPTGITQEYFKEVWHSLFSISPKKSTSDINIGKVYGAGERGLCNPLLTPIDNTGTDSSYIIFTWKKMDNNKQFKFKIFDNSEDKKEIYTQVLVDTFLVLNLNSTHWNNSRGQFIWTVEPIDITDWYCGSTYRTFNVYSKSVHLNQVNAIIQSLGGESDELFYLLQIVDALNKAGWYSDAYKRLNDLSEGFEKKR